MTLWARKETRKEMRARCDAILRQGTKAADLLLHCSNCRERERDSVNPLVSQLTDEMEGARARGSVGSPLRVGIPQGGRNVFALQGSRFAWQHPICQRRMTARRIKDGQHAVLLWSLEMGCFVLLKGTDCRLTKSAPLWEQLEKSPPKPERELEMSSITG